MYMWIKERMESRKNVLVYVDKGENRPLPDLLSKQREDHIMELILLAGVAVIDLLVVLCVKRMCEFVYKKIHK